MTATAARAHSPRTTLSTTCLALLALLGSGCSSTGKDPASTADLAADAVASASALRDELVALQAQVHVTVEAMEGVVAATDKSSVFPWRRRSADGELNPAYEKFSAELAKMKKQYERTEGRSQRFKQDAQNHVDAWKRKIAELQTPDLKEKSEQRYDEAAKRVEAARSEFDATRAEYLSYQKELEEIQTTLGLDLNQDGVLALEEVIGRAKGRSSAIEKSIAKIVESTDGLITAMSAS